MRRFIENIITMLLLGLIMIISLATIYFCLDVFGIIRVPAEYSIASLFYSKIEVIANGEPILEMPTQDKRQTKKRETKNDNTVENVIATEADPLAELDRLLAEQKEQNSSSLPEAVSDSNKFYYDQLDSYGKMIYEGLYENIDKLRSGTFTVQYDTLFNELLHEENGDKVLENSFQLAINALTFDNPDLFYIDVTKIFLLTEKTTRAFSRTYKVSIGCNEGKNYLSEDFGSETVVNSAISMTEKVKNEVIARCEYAETDEEKIKIVHDLLVDTIEYDMTAGKNIYNVYGALINKRAVCEGYARACKYILDDLDIPCIIACGIGQNSTGATETHAWNYVMLDGVWYALDVTWDDPVLISGIGSVRPESRYKYYLKGSDEFFKDHFEDGNIVGQSGFKYPSLSTSNYYNN